MTDRDLVVTRLVAAPRALVFAAFTDPKHLDEWWGPRGVTTTTSAMRFEVGGEWRFVMRGPDGTDYPNLGVYREIVPNERLLFEQSTGQPDDPNRFEMLITFADDAGGTRVTLCARFATLEHRLDAEKFGAAEGGTSTMDRLEERLARQLRPAEPGSFLLMRVFHAPRALVFEAWTEARHLSKWFGSTGAYAEVVTLEPTPGGVFHYRMGAMWGLFQFKDVVPNERLVFISQFSDEHRGTTRHPLSETWPRYTHSTLTLHDLGDRTLVELRAKPHDATEVEVRTFEGALASLTKGWSSTLETLTTHLASQAA